MPSGAGRRLFRALLSTAASPSSGSLRTLTALSPPSSFPFGHSRGWARHLLRCPWSIIQQRGVKVHGSEMGLQSVCTGCLILCSTVGIYYGSVGMYDASIVRAKFSPSVRPGNVIERKGRLYEVVKADHNQQGRGSAMIQVELRDVESGNKVNARFNTDESVEKVFVEEKSFTCMCTIDDEVALIDPDTFEQIDVKKDLFGKNATYLREEMKVTLRLFDDKPLSGLIPKRVICTVKDTPPPLKGVSATPAEKRALLDNGLTVKVPAFIETGEAILVSTEDDSYISRAKEWHADT